MSNKGVRISKNARTSKKPGRGGRGGVYTSSQSGTSKNRKIGWCKELDGNIFDYGWRTAADQMRNSQVEIVQYVGTKYGEDIANELENQRRLILPVAAYPQGVLNCHAERVALVRTQQITFLDANIANLQLVELELAESPNN